MDLGNKSAAIAAAMYGAMALSEGNSNGDTLEYKASPKFDPLGVQLPFVGRSSKHTGGRNAQYVINKNARKRAKAQRAKKARKQNW